MEPNELLLRLAAGDEQVVADEFDRHRERLARMVQMRMDARLRKRVDADDVLQEAYLDAVQRVSYYVRNPTVSFFVWLRQIVLQTLVNVHRRHLTAKARDASREVVPQDTIAGAATSVSIARLLVGHLTSPSQAAMKAELARMLEQALEGLKPIDREVLMLRHFEDLTNGEIAEVLEIDAKAASIRYVRAIMRLKGILEQIPGFFDL